MQDKLRNRFIEYLAAGTFATLSGGTATDLWSIPVCYQLEQTAGAEFAIDCTFPAWTAAAFHVSERSEAMLLVLLEHSATRRWVEVRGCILKASSPALRSSSRVCTARLSPTRLDQLDEQRGVRETPEW